MSADPRMSRTNARWRARARSVVNACALLALAALAWNATRARDGTSAATKANEGEFERRARESECERASRDWVREQREKRQARVARRRAVGNANAARDDFLFFLHVPRTAGRSYHFCFLKPAFERSKQCGNMYNGLDFDPNAPECEFLATHDDFSLVERFESQPRVVTMLRSPYDRVLSSYEFAIEVAARAFDQPPQKPPAIKAPARVQTRDVFPWGHLVRHVDAQLQSYLDKVKRNPKEMVTISDVYDNDLYTPFEHWAELDFVHEDVHNGQFFQLLGLTNITDAHVEPNARKLRQCALWRGTEASNLLIEYAKERLEKEIDSLALHERLDDSLRLSARELDLPLNAPAHVADNGSNYAVELEKILRARDVQQGEDVVGFVMRFPGVSDANLQDDNFLKQYRATARAAVASACDLEESRVAFGMSWVGGWHTVLVTYMEKPSSASTDYAEVDGTALKVASTTAASLHDAVMRGLTFDVLFAGGDVAKQNYGKLEVVAGGRASKTSRRQKITAEPLVRVTARTLGQQYRVCESGQFSKYARLRSRALQRITARIKGTYDTFSQSGRLRISQRVKARVKELNWLDDELWRFGSELWNSRFEEFDLTADVEEGGRDYLPPRLTASAKTDATAR